MTMTLFRTLPWTLGSSVVFIEQPSNGMLALVAWKAKSPHASSAGWFTPCYFSGGSWQQTGHNSVHRGDSIQQQRHKDNGKAKAKQRQRSCQRSWQQLTQEKQGDWLATMLGSKQGSCTYCRLRLLKPTTSEWQGQDVHRGLTHDHATVAAKFQCMG